MSIEDVILFAKFVAGKLSANDGSVCKFSRKFWDEHGWRVRHGGDDMPMPGKIHTCWKCGKTFV